MRANFRMFKGTLKSWEELFGEATAFATELGETQVINISHSADGSKGTVTVWYWED